MLLKFFRDKKAYISLFLCIVLLPMVTYSTMIIDACRIQSARVSVQSAGDLAMNGAMSEYEKVLEDMYGLFANATSEEDLRPALQNYFEETISGKINNGKDQNNYAAKFAKRLTDVIMKAKYSTPEEAAEYEKQLSNFLAMQLDETENGNPAFNIEAVKNSAISNPNIMKAQIVDYMKYKGPVSVGSNMLKKIGAMKDMKSQADAIEQKVELTQQIAELGTPMEEAYYAINNPDKTDRLPGYNQDAASYNAAFSGDKLVSFISNLGSKCNEMETNYLYLNYVRFLEEQMAKEKEEAPAVGPTGNWLDELPDTSSATKEQIKQKLDTIWDSIMQGGFITIYDKDSGSSFCNRYGTFTYTQSVDEDGNTTIDNFQFNENMSPSTPGDYYSTLGNLNKWAADLNNIDDGVRFKNACTILMKWRQTDELPAYVKYIEKLTQVYHETVKEYEDVITADCYTLGMKELRLKECKKSVDGVQSEYSKILGNKSLLEDIDTAVKWSSTNENYSDLTKWINNNKTIFLLNGKAALNEINENFSAFYTIVAAMEERTKTAVEKLDELSGQVGNVEDSANTLKTNIGKNVKDKDAQSKLTNDVDTLAQSINKEDLLKLRNQLSGYHDTFEEMRNTLEKVSHLDKPLYLGLNESFHWTDEKFKNQASKTYYKIIGDSETGSDKVIDENDLRSDFVEGIKNWDKIYNGVSVQSPFNKEFRIIDGSTPEENFYNVLKNSVEAEPAKDEEEQENLDKLKENSKVDENGKPEKTPSDPNKKSETPAAGEESSNENIIDVPDECVKGAAEAFSSAVDELKPGETGSYGKAQSASVPSGKSDAKSCGQQATDLVKLGNQLLSAISSLGTELKNDVFLEEYFTEVYTCHTDTLKKPCELKMLNGYTNNPKAMKCLNTATPWYGLETEYILWGNSDLNANFETTKNTIFLIRFVINMIYAFTASDIQAMATSLATLLVGWTVVLVPVVQVCIIIACALAESAMDLAELVDGKDVPLIKDATTFRCSPGGAINAAIDFAVDETVKYAEEKLDQGINALEEKAEQGVENCSQEVDKVVDEYMKTTTENVKATIKANITVPLITSITPAINSLNDAKTNAEDLLNSAFDRAMESARANAQRMEEGIVKSLTDELINKVVEKKNDIVNEIKQSIQDKTGLQDISANSIQAVIDAKVNDCISNISGSINQKLKSVRKNVTDAIKEKIKNGTESVRDAVNSTLADAGETLKTNTKDFVKDNIGDMVGDVRKNASSPASRLTMNYKEYCKLFVFIGMIDNTNEEKMLKRASVLMQVNVRYAVNGSADGKIKSAGTADFKMQEAYTLFHVQTDVKMATMYPWAVKIEESETDANAALDLSHIGKNYVNLHYSGIAGY